MDYIDSIINSLNEIQENLSNILIPAIISAIISVITLIVNVGVQIWITKKQYKNNQYEIMREIYPKLKSKLNDIICFYEILEANALYTRDFSINSYLKFDWQGYRQNISIEETQHIDEYELIVKKIIFGYTDLYKFFEEQNLPISSKKVQKSLNKFQRFCAFIFHSNTISKQYSNNYHKIELEHLVDLLDEFYNKY